MTKTVKNVAVKNYVDKGLPFGHLLISSVLRTASCTFVKMRLLRLYKGSTQPLTSAAREWPTLSPTETS